MESNLGTLNKLMTGAVPAIFLFENEIVEFNGKVFAKSLREINNLRSLQEKLSDMELQSWGMHTIQRASILYKPYLDFSKL